MTGAIAGRPPLQGVKVLDLSRLLPGPMATLHLGDLGADVIKIEDLGAGDYASAGVRELINRNKRGMRIDLILGTASVVKRSTFCVIDRNARKGTLPSDHAPVLVDLSDA